MARIQGLGSSPELADVAEHSWPVHALWVRELQKGSRLLREEALQILVDRPPESELSLEIWKSLRKTDSSSLEQHVAKAIHCYLLPVVACTGCDPALGRKNRPEGSKFSGQRVVAENVGER